MTADTLPLLPGTEYEPSQDGAGLGALRTDHGNLPLRQVQVQAAITGLTAQVQLRQTFHNPHGVPLEATYVFPLPDRAAVTALRMEADGRVVDGVLKEREQARADYQQAIEQGQRASIAEEERPDVFTMRVGNLVPGEQVTVTLSMIQPLPYADGEATFRFPLVVAPRYVPGTALGGEPVGAGWAPDTDATPDASRITPPVLLPGFPNPVQLDIDVDVDPGGLPLGGLSCSLHAVRTEGRRVRLHPGERADRDFVLRLAYGLPDANTHALVCAADEDSPDSGTFQLTVLPPTAAGLPRPRDVVVVLDRSGSMQGWKMIAARRAAARIVDTLNEHDRFTVLTFDNTVERPAGLPNGLAPASDRNRYRAVEHLARTEARGGTELLRPLSEAAGLLAGDAERDRVLVLVTDGQVGNEDQLVATLSPALAGIRVHTVGIDRAVNAGFLTRLAVLGGGRCELVESEDRLDAAAVNIHRRIGAPLVTDVRLEADPDGPFTVVGTTVAPARLPDLFPGVPLVITGRWRGGSGALTLTGQQAGRQNTGGQPWSVRVPASDTASRALAPLWARAHLRDLEDRYLSAALGDTDELQERIVRTSLRFGVLCRFTAYVAIDSRVVADGSVTHRVVQPVEPASGWDMLSESVPMFAAAPMALARHTGLNFAADSAAPMARAVPGAAAGGLGAKAASRGRRAVSPAPSRREHGSDQLDWMRLQAAEEVRRLREAAGQPVALRCALLSDLGSRLDAMAHALGPATALVEQLRELAQALLTARESELEQLWQHAITVLDELARGEEPTTPRRLFWKRR